MATAIEHSPLWWPTSPARLRQAFAKQDLRCAVDNVVVEIGNLPKAAPLVKSASACIEGGDADEQESRLAREPGFSEIEQRGTDAHAPGLRSDCYRFHVWRACQPVPLQDDEADGSRVPARDVRFEVRTRHRLEAFGPADAERLPRLAGRHQVGGPGLLGI